MAIFNSYVTNYQRVYPEHILISHVSKRPGHKLSSSSSNHSHSLIDVSQPELFITIAQNRQTDNDVRMREPGDARAGFHGLQFCFQRLALFFTASWNKFLSTCFMFPEQGDHQSARSLHYIKYKKKVCSKQSKAYKLQKNGKEIFEPKVPTSMTGPPIDCFFFVVFSRFWPLAVLAFFRSRWQNSC